MTVVPAPADTVLGLWRALSDRDWDAVAPFLADGCIYLDVPFGPALAARGPADIVARLKVGLEELSSYRNHDGLIVADGDDVTYEHSETWTWTTGEVAELPFVTVHRVRDGQITLWKDYWDSTTLMNNAPPSWMDDLLSADTSWVYDATGQI
ncbi:nuclear transport factor 2 family protein [Gordonia sp. HNM0687]|uniref:Nuclear transport factor 2 family protein n=1 Tax=Gordonia mangrovi TaxID=2665643 RepID=A0A6L7GVU6_9ACTN|nr:nuclear transport factor 2 family protein [Gordonia mangrovi]MXP24096.1 nuclear transport factor 2 family protein [Gordonia mangrovi]UVF78101.1 nuclear transport factor 2 family protein [Gordonia mangrovi]